MAKIWILTQGFNEYDQHGDCFVAAFSHKPMFGDVAKALGLPSVESMTDDQLLLAADVMRGGGRKKDEYTWWNLFEVASGVPVEVIQ